MKCAGRDSHPTTLAVGPVRRHVPSQFPISEACHLVLSPSAGCRESGSGRHGPRLVFRERSRRARPVGKLRGDLPPALETTGGDAPFAGASPAHPTQDQRSRRAKQAGSAPAPFAPTARGCCRRRFTRPFRGCTRAPVLLLSERVQHRDLVAGARGADRALGHGARFGTSGAEGRLVHEAPRAIEEPPIRKVS